MSLGTVVSTSVLGSAFPGAQVMFDIVTRGNRQYAAYFDKSSPRRLCVKYRTLGLGGAPDGAWSPVASVNVALYNPDVWGYDDSFEDRWDSHNYIKMGIDASGNLHIAADHHATELRYWRTSTPGDLSTLVRKKDIVFPNGTSKGADPEGQVTYPEFINDSAGNLRYFVFRDGVSGNGIVRVYEWNNTAKTWSQKSIMFGNSSSYFPDTTGNAYNEIFMSLDGWYHIVYNWRGTADANSNTRLSYVKTQDFSKFYAANGTVVADDAPGASIGPYSPAALVVDPIPAGDTGFVNGEYQFIKVRTYAFIAYAKKVNGILQIHVARFDDTNPSAGWVIHQMTASPTNIGYGLGNGFPDNYIAILDANTLAIDFGLTAEGKVQYRMVFPIATWNSTTYTPVAHPGLYPDEVYQPLGTVPAGLPAVVGRVIADSKSGQTTNDIYNRYAIDSRPAESGVLYVMSWLTGPETFNINGVPAWPGYPGSVRPSQTTEDAWPVRPIIVSKVVYP